MKKVVLLIAVWLIITGFPNGVLADNGEEYDYDYWEEEYWNQFSWQEWEVGIVGWYDRRYCQLEGTTYGQNCFTADGYLLDDTQFTCACLKEFDLGTILEVRYDGKLILVECTDRGSFGWKYGRHMDLTRAAFAQLAPLGKGLVTVTYRKWP